ncbi:MAG: endolytic transglycosylase MltG [Hornefia sp.]|nr:endolytic transglycosylase MltG [Hornefia sp.]
MSRSKKAKSKSRMPLKIFLFFVTIGVAVILGLFIYANSIGGNMKDKNDKNEILVTVEKGSSTSSISDLLKKKGIIDSAAAFKIYTAINRYDGSYQAGSYAFSPSMTTEQIADALKTGKTNDITFTIPEGFTEYDIADKLAKIGLVKRDEFVNTLETAGFAAEFPFLKNAQKGKHRLEGYLFPSTYKIPAASDYNFIITTMLKGYQDNFSHEDRSLAKKLGVDENKIIIIASIIEKEAAVDKDRDKVASVIYNRLKAKMPLQMDSTVQYVLGLDNNRKKDLSIDDTQVKSPYNTYTNKGLPPGPICCPGRASIHAALNPANTKYMYFILSDKLDDSMTFSEKYSQFLKDKDAYYNARDKKEGKNN